MSSVKAAQARKHAAPSAVVQFEAAWSIIDPVVGTTCPAMAEMANRMHPSRLTDASHHPGPPRTGNQPRRAETPYAMKPEIRKKIEPIASGRHTSRLYSGFDSAVCIARNVVTLKHNVPADLDDGGPPVAAPTVR